MSNGNEIHSHAHVEVFPGSRGAVHIELTFGASIRDEDRESIAHAVAVLVEARLSASRPDPTLDS